MATSPDNSYGELSPLVAWGCVLSYIGYFTVSAFLGPKIGKVSDRYYIRVVPPSFFFTIWGVIFLTTIPTVIWALYNDVWTLQTAGAFLTYCFLISLWVIVFTIGDTRSVSIAAFILSSLAVSQYFLWLTSEISPENLLKYNINVTMYYFMRLTFAFQLGWLAAASLLSFTMFLVYGLKVPLSIAPVLFWALVPVVQINIFKIAFSASDHSVEKFVNTFGSFYASTGWAIIGATISTISSFKKEKSKQ